MANKETVRDFILGGPKITAVGDYSQEIKDACSLEEKLWQKKKKERKKEKLWPI